jgi:hypothetical protein
MTKKKPESTSEPDPETVTPILYRPLSWELVRAIDRVAKKLRRSRNMAMTILFEEALAARGELPPQPD